MNGKTIQVVAGQLANEALRATKAESTDGADNMTMAVAALTGAIVEIAGRVGNIESVVEIAKGALDTWVGLVRKHIPRNETKP
jgi:hypothetical protein